MTHPMAHNQTKWACLQFVCLYARIDARQDSFRSATRLIHMCDMTHSEVRHDWSRDSLPDNMSVSPVRVPFNPEAAGTISQKSALRSFNMIFLVASWLLRNFVVVETDLGVLVNLLRCQLATKLTSLNIYRTDLLRNFQRFKSGEGGEISVI